jgi:DNA-binding NarL/FixJ family response regulator
LTISSIPKKNIALITIIGYNPTISEGLADLITAEEEIQFIQFPPKRNFKEIELKALVKSCSLIIINLDNIYNSALNFIKSIHALGKDVKILALDTHKSPTIANHILQQGVSAYLPITTNTDDLAKAIEACILGETYISV